MRFPAKKTSSCIWVTTPVDWVILHRYACGADGRSLGRAVGRCTVTWLPNFHGWVDYWRFLKILRENAETSLLCLQLYEQQGKEKKDPVKYPEVANVTFHCFPQKNDKIQYVPGMSERESRRRWIAACRLESLNVTRHTRICSKQFEGGLGPTKANPVPTIFDFPENLQRKEVKPRQDPEGRRLKNASTTSKIQKASKRGNSKVRKCPDLVEQQ